MSAEEAWKKDRGKPRNEQWVAVRRRYELLQNQLDERSLRCWAGAEALAIGRGGMAVVSEACKMSPDTVRTGVREVQQAAPATATRRVRRAGGGRKQLTAKNPKLVEELEKLVSPATRGDPESPLRWTSKSLRKLADELTAAGHPASVNVVSQVLRDLNYSLQANRKT
ncbi:MAG: ISAzo13-like element transposase-related protein, partial [Terriglobales bacterium]